MVRSSKIALPFADWPEEDHKRWVDANKSGTTRSTIVGPPPILLNAAGELCKEATVDFWGSFRPNDPIFSPANRRCGSIARSLRNMSPDGGPPVVMPRSPSISITFVSPSDTFV